MPSQYCPQRCLSLIQCQGGGHLGRRVADKSQTPPSTSEVDPSCILVIPQQQCGCKLDLSCGKGLGNLIDLGLDTQHTRQDGCMPQCISVSKQEQCNTLRGPFETKQLLLRVYVLYICDSLDICHSIFRYEHGSLCRGTAHNDTFHFQSTLAACA